MLDGSGGTVGSAVGCTSLFTPAVHPGREPDGLVMLTLASSYEGLEYLFSFVVAGISLAAALIMLPCIASVICGPVSDRTRRVCLVLAVLTFPVLHPLLLLGQWHLTNAFIWPGRGSASETSLGFIWFFGVPATLATIPTAIALAAAWRRPVLGWLAVGTTAALSVAAGMYAEAGKLEHFLVVWAFGAPVLWLAVVCTAANVLQPPEWSTLSQSHDRCPACGYSTAGLKQAVCPECGGSLSVQPAPGTSRTG